MKNKYQLLFSILISLFILGSAIMVTIKGQPNSVSASSVNPSQACCRAGIRENFCTPGTGNEWEYFSTQAECDVWEQTLNTYGYLCNPGEGGVNGSCVQEGDRIRCRGGIGKEVVNYSLCGGQATPTPVPYQPAPTPVPAVAKYRCATYGAACVRDDYNGNFSDYGDCNAHCVSYATPTPYPTTPPYYQRPTCSLNITSSGLMAYATVYAQNAQGQIQYTYNFGDNSGDLQSYSNNMNHQYGSQGYYSATAFVRDGTGQTSDRCYAQININPGYYQPTPSPSTTCPWGTQPVFSFGGITCVPIQQPPVIVQPQPQPIIQPIIQPAPAPQITVNQQQTAQGGNASSNASTGPITITLARESGSGSKQIVQTVSAPAELPKTGLPAVAWLMSGLVPAGIGLRRFRSLVPKGNIGRFLWERREYLKDE